MKFDIVDHGTASNMPQQPDDNRLPSTLLVKSYVDAEHKRAARAEDALAASITSKEDVCNKDGTMLDTQGRPIQKFNPVHYPTSQAVAAYTQKIVAEMSATKVEVGAFKPQVGDAKRWSVSDVFVVDRNVDNWVINFGESNVADGSYKVVPITLERATGAVSGLMGAEDYNYLYTAFQIENIDTAESAADMPSVPHNSHVPSTKLTKLYVDYETNRAEQ
jgi:hypothetical protein